MRSRLLPIVLCVLWGSLFCQSPVQAAPIEDESFFFVPKNAIEVTTANESVSPHSVYGNWTTLSVKYSRKEAIDFNWFAQVDSNWRNTGNGLLLTVGGYKDWNDSFYTYTALSAGSNVDYLQKFRLDQNFYFKFGAEKQHVWNIGGSIINYHDVYRDRVISTGITTFKNRWSFSFDIFRTVSDPGSVTSYTREFGVGYGKDGYYMTQLIYSNGKEAYLATDLATPAAQRSDSTLWSLSHRRWLGLERNHGYVFEISRFDLQNTYKSVGFSFGIFREY